MVRPPFRARERFSRMTERDESSLKYLEARLRKLRAETGEGGRPGGKPDGRSDLGFAMRVGVEIVAALAVGTGIGLLLDRWLGTAPWLMVVFFVFGAAAGFLNVYRLMAGMDQAVGLGRARRERDEAEKKRDPQQGNGSG
jgi:ATP synthase protein I